MLHRFLISFLLIFLFSCNNTNEITGCSGSKKDSFYVGLHKIKIYKLKDCRKISLKNLKDFPKNELSSYYSTNCYFRTHWKYLDIKESFFQDLDFELKTAIQVSENQKHVNIIKNLITDMIVNQNDYFISGFYCLYNIGTSTEYKGYDVYYILNKKTKKLITVDNREY